jgi:glycosyltransferase involved in cell wall biosynthesis
MPPALRRPQHIICAVTNDLSQDQRMHRICQTLSGAGFDVTLVGRKKSNSLPLPERSYRQWRLPVFWQKGKLFYVAYNIRLCWWLLRQKPDIINAVDLDTLLACYIGSRWHGVPLYYDAHEYFTETPEVVRRVWVRRVWSLLAACLLPRVAKAYTVGPQLASILSRKYGIPFGVVRNLPFRQSITQQVQQQSAGLLPLLYQGMLNEGRGLETAIRALCDLPACVLWLVGNGDKMENLQKLARQVGVEDRVVFWGFIPPADLLPFCQKAWLGLNLLENTGLSYYYSLANKTFDYLQAGLPAINMNFPEYRQLHQQYQTSLLLDELTPQALSQCVQQLIDQPEEWQRLRTACSHAAEELCWENEQAALLALFDTQSPPALPA